MIKKNLQKQPINYTDIFREYGLDDIDEEGILYLEFEQNETLCCEGQQIEYLIFLLNGKAKVLKNAGNGKILLVNFYISQGIIGDVELMTGKQASTTVQAINRLICIGIPLKKYESYLKNNLKFMKCVGTGLAQKLYRITLNSTTNMLHLLEDRLCAYIYLINKEGFFNEKLTELSEQLGCSYRHLLRTLEKLCKLGVLEKLPKGYAVKDLNAIKYRASAASYWQP